MKKMFLMAGLILCLATLSFAQINKWENVKSIPSAHRVVVETMQGKKIKGRFQTASDDTLSMTKSGKAMNLNKTDIKRVYLGKKAKSHLGGIIGGIGGFFAGGFIAAAIYNQDGRQGDGLEGLAGAVPGAVGGAIVGRRLGGGIKERDLVYAVQ